MRAIVAGILLVAAEGRAFDLCLPTANNALLKPGGDAEFFQPTLEGTVESGMFGCVRNDGRKFHEGVDIKCLKRDRRGEPLDPVHAVSDGRVAFINTKPGNSNYGRYVVLEHNWDGIQVFTLYAHLRAIADGLVIGQDVKKAHVLGTLGHSTNTRDRIPAERAHLHFEINFMLNTNFRLWYPKRDPDAPPFGNFNGQNFIGIDPAAVLRAYAANSKLNFADYMARQPVAFTVVVPARPYSWLALHPEQLPARVVADGAYELSVTGYGLPVRIESAADTGGSRRPALRMVKAAELARTNCRGLVRQGKRGWELSQRGREWLEILTYVP